MQDYGWDEDYKEAAENRDEAVIEQIARYLKNRDYFEVELRLKLRQKGFSLEDIERGLAYYRELCLIDDENLAYQYALTRLEKEGPNKVLARLGRKGVNSELAKPALDRALEELNFNQEAEVKALLEETLNTMGASSEDLDYREKQKLARKLYNKGYDIASIMKALHL